MSRIAHERSEALNVRQATLEDAESLAILNLDVQTLHASLVPAVFKAPAAGTYDAAEMRRIVSGAEGGSRGIARLATEVSCVNPEAVAFFTALGLAPYTQKMGRGGGCKR